MKRIGFFVLPLMILFFVQFQNCSNIRFEGEAGEQSTDVKERPNLGGNGEWYQGVLFSETSSAKCSDQSDKKTTISYHGINHSFWLLRENCLPIVPELLSEQEVSFADDMLSLTFEGRTLVFENSGTIEPVIFSSAGVFSWSPSQQADFFKVECWGAGGGGGGGGGNGFGGGGGGAGGYSIDIFSRSSLPSNVEVLIGQGGVGIGGGGISPLDGGIGGLSRFGDWLEAQGGLGGQAARNGGLAGQGGVGQHSNGEVGQSGAGSQDPNANASGGGKGGSVAAYSSETGGAGGPNGGANEGLPGSNGLVPGGGGGGSGGGGGGGANGNGEGKPGNGAAGSCVINSYLK